MAVITIASLKGGCGKTTHALSLAAAFTKLGESVVVIDADAQASASTWASVRDADKPMPFSVIAAVRASLHRDIEDLQGDRSLAIIDTPSKVAKITLSAMLAADFILLLTQPSTFDLDALQKTLEQLEEVRLLNEGVKVAVALARVPVGSSLEREVRPLLKDLDVSLLRACQCNRVAYLRSGDGVTVFEVNDDKAQRETMNLAREIRRKMEDLGNA